MPKKQIFTFLKDLENNNSKAWMDEHRDRYFIAKNSWLAEIEEILSLLSKYDFDYFSQFKPKETISRINNNRRFNQSLPIYKNYFTFSVMDKSDGFSPLHISVGPGQSFIGCGYHNPDKELLKKIRDAIDYDGQVLQDILHQTDFEDFFGGLSTFKEPLKTSPRAYAKDHPHVDLLRFKSFIVSRNLSDEEATGADFLNILEQAFVLSKAFRDYLKRAGSFEI
ncbi:MAG: hypothetical protein Sapg2KO_33550 [Saprospiraceae bacterium]